MNIRLLGICLVLLALSVGLSLSTVTGMSHTVTHIDSYIVTIRSCDGVGNVKTVFAHAEFVYASGVGYLANEEVIIRVIPDLAPYTVAFSVIDRSISLYSQTR